MRIDEIDLFGLVKVKGESSTTGKVLSYGETGLTWSVASSQASPSVIKKSGYNYLIVETVKTGDTATDSVTNGDRLIAAYDQAKAETIGTLSATNRFTILLTPGLYDLQSVSYLDFDTSFIDIVGISSKPESVTITNTGNTYVFNYHEGIDNRLENMKIDALIFNNTELNQYLRWKNLVFSGDPFNEVWSDINGEFENIKSLLNFANNVSNSLNGTYKNIECGQNSFAMSNIGTPTLTGTFSNIKIYGVYNFAFYNINGSLSGHFEDISMSLDVGNAGSQEVFRAADINGTFKNINVINDVAINTFFAANGGSINGTFEKIKLSSTSANTVYSASGLTMSGTFKDIYLPTTVYAFDSGQDIIGTFSNITVGDVTVGGFMYASTTLIGTFEDIKVGSVNGYAYYAGVVDGTYKNIEIDTVNASTFNSLNLTFNGTFENIKINNTVTGISLFYSNTNLTGIYKNIEINNIDTSIILFGSNAGDINIEIKNLKTTNINSSLPNIFYAPNGGSNIFGTYEDIYLAETYNCFYTFGTLDITAKNFYLGASTYLFYGYSNLLGSFENINLLGNVNTGFYTNVDINLTLDGLYSDEVQNIIFYSQGGISGTYKNIRLAAVDVEFCSALGSNIDATFENVYIGSGSGNAFYADNTLEGKFKNIEIGSSFDKVFYQDNKLACDITLENVTIGDCLTSALDISFSSNTFARNVVSRNFMGIYAVMRGEWIDCDLDQYKGGAGIGNTFNLNGIVRNSKLLGRESGPPAYGVYGSGQVTHTILYETLDGSFPLTPNYNVEGYS